MTDDVRSKINELFQRLCDWNLQTSKPRLESGWEMELPTGERVTRSVLQTEAQTIIEMGAAAIPELIPFVRHENLGIRYVAIFTLESIVGKKSGIPYFKVEGVEETIEQAIDDWQAWYEKVQLSE